MGNRFDQHKIKQQILNDPIATAHRAIDRVMVRRLENRDQARRHNSRMFLLMKKVYEENFGGQLCLEDFAEFLGWGLSTLGLQLKQGAEDDGHKNHN